MKSAIFKVPMDPANSEQNQQYMQDIQIIYVNDEAGNPIDGCGYNLPVPFNYEEGFLTVAIKTTDEVMDTLLTDPRLELMEQLEGWPESEPEQGDEI